MPRNPSRARSRVVRLLLGLVGLGVLGAAGAAGVVYWTLLRDLPDLRSIDDYQPALTSVVLDRDGRPMGEFYEERRKIVPLEEIPPHVVQAFIAAEDGSFYEHTGIDMRSIVRAAWTNFVQGGKVQGASTITQQTVKQLLLSSERTYSRKIREMILARRIEERFSKDDILFLYLNHIYFGSGAYGIGEAAYTYFGKQAPELTVGEAALLAGLPKAPSKYSPHNHPERAETRQHYVLERMREDGYLDGAAWEEAMANPPALVEPVDRSVYADTAYFTEEVRRELVETLGNEQVLRGGLVVETTADLELQREAARAVRAGLEAHDRRQGWRGPVRQVDASAVGDEAVRLAEENGLLDEEGEPLAELPGDRPLLGVVTAVSRKLEHARVAFAPGLEGVVPFETVSWARPVESDLRKVRHIDEVFSAGDVATFRVSEAEPTEDGEPQLALVQRPETQGALLSVDLATGDVLAMVGGYDFEASEFNRVTQARRQPGSAFKPIIYAAALDKGMTSASILYDRPVVYDDPESGFTWRPQNYGRRFLGPLTMSEALARSVNNATIHLLRDVGVGHVLSYARRLGIESPLERNLSLALGSSPVSLLELTRAYAVFASGGRRVTPRYIRRVLDRDGQVLLESVDLEGPAPVEEAEAEIRATESADGPEADGSPLDEQVLSPVEAFLAADLLRSVVTHPRGTGRRARSLGKPVAGKTGTTNEQGDAWFMGFSPDVATGVWVGYDEKRVLGPGETGGRAALPIWLDFMKLALAERPAREFAVPEGIVFARIDGKTGLIASADSENARFQAFAADSVPAAAVSRHQRQPRKERGQRVRLDF